MTLNFMNDEALEHGRDCPQFFYMFLNPRHELCIQAKDNYRQLFTEVIAHLLCTSDRPACVIYVERRKSMTAHYFTVTSCGNDTFLLGQTNHKDYSIAESFTNNKSRFMSTADIQQYLTGNRVEFSTNGKDFAWDDAARIRVMMV